MRIDLLDWEATQFDLDLNEVIVPIHEAAVTSLQAVHYDGERAAQEAIREADAAGNEGESQLEWDLAKVEIGRAKERERVIGWLALVHLAIVLELKLNNLYDFLERISLEQGRRATALRGNRRTRSEKNWLRKLSDKYHLYGVHLESHPKFSFIDELVFACNAVKHSAGKPGGNYRRAYPDWRFVDGELVVFSNRDFKDSVDSLREFVEWVVRELKHRRDGQIPVGPLQRPRPSLRD
ncbi:MAG: hypothetical protein LAO04_10720 [Acidobacteriia bacterium]|nr:hypothetical protein [Terriglobia bacterium]